MNKNQLNKLKYINIELNRLDKQIYKIKSNEDQSCFIKKYLNGLLEQKENLFKQKIEIEEFINQIEDTEIKLIILMRFVDIKSWEDIAEVLHYSRTSVFYKYKNYIDKHNKN